VCREPGVYVVWRNGIVKVSMVQGKVYMVVGYVGIVGAVIDVVVVDEKGRVVIPREVRERLGLSKGSRLLLMELDRDTIVLRKLDVRRLLKVIASEVSEKGIDLEEIEREVEEEADRIAAKKIEEILAGH